MTIMARSSSDNEDIRRQEVCVCVAECTGVKLGGVVSIMPSDTGTCSDDIVI